MLKTKILTSESVYYLQIWRIEQHIYVVLPHKLNEVYPKKGQRLTAVECFNRRGQGPPKASP